MKKHANWIETDDQSVLTYTVKSQRTTSPPYITGSLQSLPQSLCAMKKPTNWIETDDHGEPVDYLRGIYCSLIAIITYLWSYHSSLKSFKMLLKLFILVVMSTTGSAEYFIYHGGAVGLTYEPSPQCNGWEYLSDASAAQSEHVFQCTEDEERKISIGVSPERPIDAIPFRDHFGTDIDAGINGERTTIKFIQFIRSEVHYVLEHRKVIADIVGTVYHRFFARAFWEMELHVLNKKKVFGKVVVVDFDALKDITEQRTIKIFDNPKILYPQHPMAFDLVMNGVFANNLKFYYAPFTSFGSLTEHTHWSEVMAAMGEKCKDAPIPIDVFDLWEEYTTKPFEGERLESMKWQYLKRETEHLGEYREFGLFKYHNKRGQMLYVYRSSHTSSKAVEHIKTSMDRYLAPSKDVVLVEMKTDIMKGFARTPGYASEIGQEDMLTTFTEALPRQTVLADIEMPEPVILTPGMTWGEYTNQMVYGLYWMQQRNLVMADMIYKTAQKYSDAKHFWITIGSDHWSNLPFSNEDTVPHTHTPMFVGIHNLLIAPEGAFRTAVSHKPAGYSYLFKVPSAIESSKLKKKAPMKSSGRKKGRTKGRTKASGEKKRYKPKFVTEEESRARMKSSGRKKARTKASGGTKAYKPKFVTEEESRARMKASGGKKPDQAHMDDSTIMDFDAYDNEHSYITYFDDEGMKVLLIVMVLMLGVVLAAFIPYGLICAFCGHILTDKYYEKEQQSNVICV